MKLCVVTALWGRPKVSSIMLDSLALQRERLQDLLDLEVVAVGSEGGWSRYLAESHGATYCESENKPLGRKWQAALRRARALAPDAVMVLGSDNLVNDEFIRFWVERLRYGDEYLGVLDAYQWNPHHGTLVHWDGYVDRRAGEPIGSSRCFARSLLDRMRWQIWEESYNRGLDWSTTQKLREIGHRRCVVTMRDRPMRHLGIKVSGAMSPTLDKHRTCQHLDPRALLDWFGDAGARALALADTRVATPPNTTENTTQLLQN